MATQRFALPPGLYRIQANINDGRYLQNAGTDGGALALVEGAGTASKWMISGDGMIRDVATKNKFVSAHLDNGIVPQALVRSATAVKWVISTREWKDGDDEKYYTGQIHSNVVIAQRAEADARSNTVVLHVPQAVDTEQWRFYPTS